MVPFHGSVGDEGTDHKPTRVSLPVPSSMRFGTITGMPLSPFCKRYGCRCAHRRTWCSLSRESSPGPLPQLRSGSSLRTCPLLFRRSETEPCKCASVSPPVSVGRARPYRLSVGSDRLRSRRPVFGWSSRLTTRRGGLTGLACACRVCLGLLMCPCSPSSHGLATV